MEALRGESSHWRVKGHALPPALPLLLGVLADCSIAACGRVWVANIAICSRVSGESGARLESTG